MKRIKSRSRIKIFIFKLYTFFIKMHHFYIFIIIIKLFLCENFIIIIIIIKRKDIKFLILYYGPTSFMQHGAPKIFKMALIATRYDH